jgi:predicted amidohydrolase
MSDGRTDNFTVGVIQTPAGGVGANAVVDIAEGLSSHDLLVLPEMANTSYFPLSGVDEGHRPGPNDHDLGPTLEPYRALAERTRSYVVAGLCITDGDRVRNAAVVLDRNGCLLEGRGLSSGLRRAVYDKTHLCNVRGYGSTFTEDDHFEPGPELMIWDLDFARLGVLICYDRHFPGAWAALTSHGADIVAVPTASPQGTKVTFAAEMQAMALQQSVVVAIANRQGREDLGRSDVTYLGQSMVIAPDGRIAQIAGTDGPGFASATFEPTAVPATARAMGMRQAQRPDLYTYQPTS